jgi:hypothetical protein
MAAVRLGRDLPAYLRAPFNLEAARARVRREVEHREDRLLALAETLIYSRPQSPYARLLRHVGCEPGDLRALVGREGLEGALRILADAGVYLAHDEHKGRRETVRGSMRFRVSDHDLDNHAEPAHMIAFTGGTGGRPTRVQWSLAHHAEIAQDHGLLFDAFGVAGVPEALWLTNPSRRWLYSAHLRSRLLSTYYPVEPRPPLLALHLAYLWLLLRVAGYPVPYPAYRDLREPEGFVSWLAGHREPVVVQTLVSCAVRLAAAAQSAGASMAHVTFMVQGEPVTPIRRTHIEASGARLIATYGTVETRPIAYSCPHATGADDMHLMAHTWAAILYPRPMLDDRPPVNALPLTALNPRASKVYFNAELGETATIEWGACGCPLGDLGLRVHLSNVRSYEKVSSEGTTFSQTSLLETLEVTLPARFGGDGDDYQVVEEEAPDGLIRLILRVSPNVGAVDEQAVRAAFLTGLARSGMVGQSHAALLERAASVVIARQQPTTSQGGKVVPFQAARRWKAR